MADFVLPGIKTVLNQKEYSVATTTTTATDTIVILGAAADGPMFEPVTVDRPATCGSIFGQVALTEIGSKYVMPAVNEAYGAGARSIVVMRIVGAYATKALLDEGTPAVGIEGEEGYVAPVPPATVINLSSVYAGAKYNNLFVEIATGKLNVWSVKDTGLNKTEATASFDFVTYTTAKELVDAINAATATTGLKATVATGKDAVDTADLADVVKVALAGGSDEADQTLGDYTIDEVAATGYRLALETAYDLLLDFQCDIIVPCGVYFSAETDGKDDALKLAKFCYDSAERSNDVLGHIAVKPFTSVSLAGMKTNVDALAAADNRYDHEGIDIGRYISVVCGEAVFYDVLNSYYVNTAVAAYAGLTSALAAQSGTTNKVLPGVTELRYNLSPLQLAKLGENKLVTLQRKYGRGIVVTEGVLASKPNTDFQSQSSVRVIFAIMKGVREAADPFIGEPMDKSHIDALRNAISEVINSGIDNKVISGGDYEVYFSNDSAIIGDLLVELELDIPSEVRRIICTVTRRIPESEA